MEGSAFTPNNFLAITLTFMFIMQGLPNVCGVDLAVLKASPNLTVLQHQHPVEGGFWRPVSRSCFFDKLTQNHPLCGWFCVYNPFTIKSGLWPFSSNRTEFHIFWWARRKDPPVMPPRWGEYTARSAISGGRSTRG